MLSLGDYLWDCSIIYYYGMSDEELHCRLKLNEDEQRDKFLFAGIPTTESKAEIQQYLKQLQWQQIHFPSFIPLPQIHISIRFNFATLISHIEQLKQGIDSIEKYKRAAPIPVEDVALTGKHGTLFSFMFSPENSSLKQANIFFNQVYRQVTGDMKTFPLIPHMTLAKYVQKMPLGKENYPRIVPITYAIVRGILAVP